MSGTLFVQARRAQSRTEFAKAYLRLGASKEKILRQRLGLGVASINDVYGAKAELSQARYLWREALSEREAAFSGLKTALGFSVNQMLSLTDEEMTKAFLPKFSGILESAQKHPDVQALAARQKQEKALESAEKAAYVPSVQAMADYGVTGKTVDDSKETYLYGVKASWNIFDFWRRSSRIHEASQRAEEAGTNFSQGLREKESKIYEARQALKAAEKLLQAKRDNGAYAQSRYDSMKNKFENGAASRLEMIAESSSLARAADDREEAVAFYRTAQINLYHALGQMENFLEKKTHE